MHSDTKELPEQLKKTIHDSFVNRLKELNMSMYRLAKNNPHINQRYMSAIINGRQNCSIALLESYLNAVGLTIAIVKQEDVDCNETDRI